MDDNYWNQQTEKLVGDMLKFLDSSDEEDARAKEERKKKRPESLAEKIAKEIEDSKNRQLWSTRAPSEKLLMDPVWGLPPNEVKWEHRTSYNLTPQLSPYWSANVDSCPPGFNRTIYDQTTAQPQGDNNEQFQAAQNNALYREDSARFPQNNPYIECKSSTVGAIEPGAYLGAPNNATGGFGHLWPMSTINPNMYGHEARNIPNLNMQPHAIDMSQFAQYPGAMDCHNLYNQQQDSSGFHQKNPYNGYNICAANAIEPGSYLGGPNDATAGYGNLCPMPTTNANMYRHDSNNVPNLNMQPQAIDMSQFAQYAGAMDCNNLYNEPQNSSKLPQQTPYIGYNIGAADAMESGSYLGGPNDATGGYGNNLCPTSTANTNMYRQESNNVPNLNVNMQSHAPDVLRYAQYPAAMNYGNNHYNQQQSPRANMNRKNSTSGGNASNGSFAPMNAQHEPKKTSKNNQHVVRRAPAPGFYGQALQKRVVHNQKSAAVPGNTQYMQRPQMNGQGTPQVSGNKGSTQISEMKFSSAGEKPQ